MPKFAHHTFDGGGIAIWHIAESADELYDMLHTQRYDAALSAIHHEARRTEWLAVRVLLAHILGSDKEIAYHPSGKPYLVDGSYHISISHTKGYAAIAYHSSREVGIDIERISSRVERIADRFTHASEMAYMNECDAHEHLMRLLINWSAKEALYKLYDSPSMAEFKEVFHIATYKLSTHGTLSVVIHNSADEVVKVNYRVFPDFVCTFTEIG